jgi:hypothetical protein
VQGFWFTLGQMIPNLINASTSRRDLTMTKIRILTLNGPLGSGKTWIKKQLASTLASHSIKMASASWQDPLRRACYALLNVSESVDYDTFKVTDYFGRTGRQWMIAMSEDFAKQFDPLFFSRVLADTLRSSPLPHYGRHLFIADSNGFDTELSFLRAQTDIEVLAGCICPPDSPPPGERWRPDDSRLNLSHMCAQVAPTSGELLPKLMKSLQIRGWI